MAALTCQLERLFSWSVFVVGVLLHVQQSQPLGLLDKGLLLLVSELLPAPPQSLGDLGVVDVGLELDDLFTLDVGEYHERVHRALDVIGRMLLGLQNNQIYLMNLCV